MKVTKLLKSFSFIMFLLFVMLLAACSSGSSNNSTNNTSSNDSSSQDSSEDKGDSGSSDEVVNLSIGGGGTSGTYYHIGAGMANMFQKHDPSIQLNVEVTAAGLENSRLLYSGDLDLAQIDGATLTLFMEDHPDIMDKWRQIGGGHSQFMHIVVPAKSDIQKVMDIVGKKVSVGAAGSGNEVVVRNLLDMYGLTYDDFEPLYLNFAESVDAFKAGQIDAFLYVTGTPAVGITDLSTTEDFRFIEVDEEQLEKVRRGEYPGIFEMTLPDGFYEKQTGPVTSIAINAQLIVDKDFPDELAYKFAKNMSENWQAIEESHPAGAEWKQDEEGLFRGAILPFHPGAVKYYKETGIWDKRPDFVKEGD